ncbi:MAG TPA: SDR family NAD(P)-dependent oxidoreductase [Caldimonas sp.]|nr:SDR family NAD(P)-dependent oxidoreductase [Caldimonas sp.]
MTAIHAAIVTGVSRGLGESLAATLLERGFVVLGVGRASSARLEGKRYRFAQIDLGDEASLGAALEPSFRALADDKPSSACLINNAAMAGPVGVLGRLNDAELASSLAVNLLAPIALANLFCRVFERDGLARRVINVSSGAAQRPLPGDAMYCVGKAGLEMLTTALAAEEKGPGFRAITVRPGIIDTDMQAFTRSHSREVLPCVDMFVEFHSQGRLVPPDTVAAKIVDRLVTAEVDNGRTYSYQEL